MVDLARLENSTEIIITVFVGLVLLPLTVYYVFVFFTFVQQVRSVARAVDKFPGPPAHWLFGNLQHVGTCPKGMRSLQKMANTYKRSFRIWLGPIKPKLIVWTTDGMKAVLKTSHAKPIGFGGGYASFPPWIGDGLLVSSGEKWFRNRKLLTPGFHFDVLKPYMKVYNAAHFWVSHPYINAVMSISPMMVDRHLASNWAQKRHPDFLDILLLAKDESGKGLNDTEIRDEVDTFLFGVQFEISLLHLNKDVWGDDVMEFKPGGFPYERTKNMDSHAYVPFSAGPRNCIGQNFAMHEIKVTVAKVVYRFDMQLDPNHKVEQHAELVTRPVNGIKIIFTPR